MERSMKARPMAARVMKGRHLRTATLVALALVASPLVAHADDTGRDPPRGAEDCVLEEKCPRTGVMCEEDRCNGEEQCPQSQVYCDDEADPQACRAQAEGAGLEERCNSFKGRVYCAASEAPVPGTPPGCAAAARAAGLTDSCLDFEFEMLLCDPTEVRDRRASSAASGGAGGDGSDSSGASDEDGCAIRRQRKRAGAPVAFAVFVAAGVVTGLRAWRRRRAG